MDARPGDDRIGGRRDPVVHGGPAAAWHRSTILRDAQDDLQREISDPPRRLDDQEDALRRLVLVCEAMWSILGERLGATPAELDERMVGSRPEGRGMGAAAGNDGARLSILGEHQEDLMREGVGSPARLARQEAQLERLGLVTEAMWSFLSERMGVTQDQLEQRMAEIDAQDGSVDGRRGPHPPEPCGTCGAAIDRTRTTCAFCGAPATPSNPFDRI